MSGYERVKAKVRERAVEAVAHLLNTTDETVPAGQRDAAGEVLFGFQAGWLAAHPDDYLPVRAGIQQAKTHLGLIP